MIPGVITHASNIVEHPELIAERLTRSGEARRAGERDRRRRLRLLVAGDLRTEVHPTVIWAKFQAMAEGARLATKELWR